MALQRLRISGVDRGDDCELVLLVGGEDVLAPLDAIGLDPDVGLPLLVPHDEPRRVTVGRCGCGDDTCGEVTVRVRRDGGAVVWDEWRSTLGFDVPGPLRFDADQYDRAVAAADAERAWESPERRFARRVASLVDADFRAALAWRGLDYDSVVPAADGSIAVQLSAAYGEAEWSVYVVLPVSDEPAEVIRLLRRLGPNAWPNVFWWGRNDAAAFQQPPMAGRRWRMWLPAEV